MDFQTLAQGHKKIGDALLGPHKRARLVLPKDKVQNLSGNEEVLVMVHMVLSDHQDRNEQKPLSLPRSMACPPSPHRPATRLRLYSGGEALAGCSLLDRDRTRCIGVRRPKDGTLASISYRTESLWLPLHGPFLFVENLSGRDEASITVSALAFRNVGNITVTLSATAEVDPVIDDRDDDESPYAEIPVREVLRPLSVGSVSSFSSIFSDASGCLPSPAPDSPPSSCRLLSPEPRSQRERLASVESEV